MCGGAWLSGVAHFSSDHVHTQINRICCERNGHKCKILFIISDDPLKWDFIAFKINMVPIRKRIADTVAVNGVTCTHTMFMT